MKKQLSLAMAAVMALSLAACGGSGDSTTSTTSGTTSDAATTEGSDASTNWGDVTLTMWGAEEDQTMLREMADAFIEENKDKGNITINIGACSESDAKDNILVDPTAAADVFAFADDQLNELVESMTDRLLEWLGGVVPEQFNAMAEFTIETAKGVPDFVVALIIYIMACYMLTVDYSYLRSRAARHTHQRLRRFLKQVRDTALAAFGGYLRAEFLLSVVVFFILLVGFFVIGQSYGLLLALGLAVMDFIPIIGAGTVMVPWAVVDLFMGNWFHAVELMLIWGVIALFRRVGEPKFVGDQTGLSPITSLISIYIGWRVAGVLGMILGPTIALVALNLIKLGLFEGVRLDLAAAAGDIMAVLRARPPKMEE